MPGCTRVHRASRRSCPLHASIGAWRSAKGTFDNRAQFFRDLTLPFYGYNRAGAAVSEGVRESFWLQGMMGGLKGQLDCIREFSEVDYTRDLERIDVPCLVVHGDDDQIVPIGAAGLRTAEIVKEAMLKIYKGGDNGLPTTHQDAVNADLLAFLGGEPVEGAVANGGRIDA
jgi:non-heme chloroperoxidase